jgi:hypothetical protein
MPLLVSVHSPPTSAFRLCYLARFVSFGLPRSVCLSTFLSVCVSVLAVCLNLKVGPPVVLLVCLGRPVSRHVYRSISLGRPLGPSLGRSLKLGLPLLVVLLVCLSWFASWFVSFLLWSVFCDLCFGRSRSRAVSWSVSRGVLVAFFVCLAVSVY